MAAGVAQGERCVFFSFEESRDQLIRNAASWGFDLQMMERTGNLHIMCEYPEMASVEDHFVRMKQAMEQDRPLRLAVDNLSALERVATRRGLRDFIIGMTSFVKLKEITSLFTSTTSTLIGGSSITEAHLSTIADTIICAALRRAGRRGSPSDHLAKDARLGSRRQGFVSFRSTGRGYRWAARLTRASESWAGCRGASRRSERQSGKGSNRLANSEGMYLSGLQRSL